MIRKRTDLHLFHHGIPKVLVNPWRKGITIYLSSLTTQTLTMIKLENDYTTLERTIKLSRQETLAHGSTILEHAIALNMKTNLIYWGL
jgi:hypothetical protein